MRHTSFMLVFVVCCAATATLVSAVDSPLVKVAVIHRHGARTGLGIVNGSETCAFPYCRLTEAGKNMLFSLGMYLNKTYGAFVGTDKPYNTSTVPSISTAVDRVVVSAQAMLLGMFGTDAIPFVDYPKLEDDVKMSWWTSWPAWGLHGPAHNFYLQPDAGPLTNLFTVNGTNYIPILGQRFPQVQAECKTAPWSCVGYVRDTLRCNISAGLPVDPIALMLSSQLEQATALAFAGFLGYQPTDLYSSSVGSYGYPLATDILTKLSQPTTNPTFAYAKLFHYAAHDWTLFGLMTALGIWQPTTADASDPNFAIQFAEALLFEYYANGTVRALRGIPNVTFGSDYAYTWTPAMLQCIPSGANAVPVRSSTCAVDDLMRQVNSTAPQSPDGICYASPDDLSTANCDTVAAPTTKTCLTFRKKCPKVACPVPATQLADPANGYVCVDMVVPTAAEVRAWVSIAVALPCALLGVLIGYFNGKPVTTWWASRAERQRLVEQAS